MILAVLLAALPSDGLEPSTAVLNFPPQLGVLIDEQGPAFAVAFQWAGELRTTTRPWLRPTHLALDAGALIGRQTRFTAHGGLRWLHALTPWALLGPGFGMGVDVGRDARPVTQLELSIRLGVGSIGFALVLLRAELRLDGTTGWSVTIGGTAG